MTKLTIFTLAALLGSSLAAYNLNSAECSTIQTCGECIAAVNNAADDTSKCLPVKGVSGAVCASSDLIDKKGYLIDHECSYALLSAAEKSDIETLKAN
jgi:hypothetical protein